MKIAFNKVFLALFIFLWFAAVVINVITPFRDFSENENRKLTEFPDYTLRTLLNGKFMNKMEEYLNDQFILRDFWISVQSVLEFSIGKREINGVLIGKDALLGKIDGPDEENVKDNIEGINSFSSLTDMPVSLMIVPGAAGIQPEKLPLFAEVWDQQRETETIYDQIEGAVCVPVWETLSDHRLDYIYYRTDHHWTTYGAYLAYSQYCAENGLAAAAYDPVVMSDSFNGTLYSTSGVRFIKSDVIQSQKTVPSASCTVFDGEKTVRYDSVFFSEYLDKKDKYAYFLGQNQPIVTLERDDGDGPALLMFKDSYAHCLAPMLLAHYSRIVLIDLRYINRNLDHYIDVDEFDAALFLYSMDTFVNQNNVYKLTSLLKTD